MWHAQPLARAPFFSVLALCALLFALCAPAQALDPATATITNTPYEATAYVSAYAFPQGESLLLTNCVILTAAGATQSLNGVQVQLKIGDTSTNLSYTANATNNAWWFLLPVPTNANAAWEPSLQIRLLADRTNTYQLKILKTRKAL
jgi:hypothetical protein